jgi:hypothetical protein
MAKKLYISLFVKIKFIRSLERDKSESVSSAVMQLIEGAMVQLCKAQVCDVLSFFCNLSKSLQESKVFFLFSFLRWYYGHLCHAMISLFLVTLFTHIALHMYTFAFKNYCGLF